MMKPTHLGPGNLTGAMREWGKGQTYRHTKRKAGVRWAMCSNGDTLAAVWKLNIFILYTTLDIRGGFIVHS